MNESEKRFADDAARAMEMIKATFETERLAREAERLRLDEARRAEAYTAEQSRRLYADFKERGTFPHDMPRRRETFQTRQGERELRRRIGGDE